MFLSLFCPWILILSSISFLLAIQGNTFHILNFKAIVRLSKCEFIRLCYYLYDNYVIIFQGQRFRTREVLTSPGQGGEQCPHLSETQSCDPEPCFQWTITVGPCMLLNTNVGDVCGLGVAYRTIGCENKYKVNG